MAYISYEDYTNLYSDGLSEADFSRLSFEADRFMDSITTGVDGVRKLKRFFPVDEDDAEAVKMCAAKIVSLLHQFDETEKAVRLAGGYEETQNGLRGKVISSVSSGTESITYASSKDTDLIAKTALDPVAKKSMLKEIAREGLEGVTDANNVNLLYMGAYPGGYRNDQLESTN